MLQDARSRIVKRAGRRDVKRRFGFAALNNRDSRGLLSAWGGQSAASRAAPAVAPTSRIGFGRFGADRRAKRRS